MKHGLQLSLLLVSESHPFDFKQTLANSSVCFSNSHLLRYVCECIKTFASDYNLKFSWRRTFLWLSFRL
jgi:hypothetical protein